MFEDEVSLAFLDHRPIFPGHCLLVPKEHYETLDDLPGSLVGPLFTNVQTLARAVELGLNADGTFVAINNRISQSVPHLHVHSSQEARGWPQRLFLAQADVSGRRAYPRGPGGRTAGNGQNQCCGLASITSEHLCIIGP